MKGILNYKYALLGRTNDIIMILAKIEIVVIV
jgi:hypothetical protein